MAGDDGDKTEDATPKRQQKAIEEGNLAKSREFSTAIVFIVSIIALYYYVPTLLTKLKGVLTHFIQIMDFNITTESIYSTFMSIIIEMGFLLLPFFSVLVSAAILANVLQSGFVLTPKAMEPKLSKINPISGFGRLFSKKSLVELIKSIIKIFAVGYIAWGVVSDELSVIITLSTTDPKTSIVYLSQLIFEIAFKIAVLLIVVALADFLYQKWQWQQDLKMSKHEIKEEFKQMEGDPIVKRRIRSLQMEMARKRMMGEVPDADVVITNPTHYAVAIRYRMGEDRAPTVVAKGQRLVALRIREMAKEHGVIVHEDPPLARSIYATVDIDEEIPENLYKAVAEILAFVYKLKNKS